MGFNLVTRALLLALLIFDLPLAAVAESQKSLFLFKDVLQSNTTGLTTTGFNTLLLFRIGVLANGDLVYYSTGGAGEAVDAPVVTNGSYVGGAALSAKIRALKTAAATDVDRVEVSLVSADATFANIRDLINASGTGPETVLYRGFEVLKDEWDVDALNNDDEGVYNVSSTVSFATMLGVIGYKYSAAPYTNVNFWTTVMTQINAETPGLFDRVYLQVYDGGAGNDPGSWQDALGMKISPIVWVTNDAKPSQGTTPAQAETKFSTWYEEYAVAGGGYWNDYDIEKMNSSYTEYAGVLNSVFG